MGKGSEIQPDNSIYLFGRIHGLANALVVEELQKAGIRDFAPSQGDILAVLFREQELTLTEIAHRIHRDRSTITTLMDKLKKMGYVAARSSLIFLTEKRQQLKPLFQEISCKLMETASFPMFHPVRNTLLSNQI